MSPERIAPAAFPPGDEVIRHQVFDLQALHEVDLRLGAGECPSGRLELENAEARLTCLIHDSKPHVAGLLEGGVYSRVPLYDFTLRARDFGASSCRLVKSDPALVLMAAVHFSSQPSLRGSVRLVDPAHVLATLAQEGRDAAVSIERAGARTLLFLHQGEPARLYFGQPAEDPQEGSLEERLLLWAFDPSAPAAVFEAFTDLKVEPDPDAGQSLADLDHRAQPPPPTTVSVTMDGRQVRERPFSPPMVIGRDPKVDLFIDNLGISRRHACLSWQRGHYRLEDLSSSNGTLVNGELVTSARVTPEDRIQMGKFEIQLVEQHAEPTAPETMLLAAPKKRRSPTGRLVVDGQAFAIEDGLLIGRGGGVDVQIRGFWVGEVHARLTLESKSAYRITCFGKRTVRVNGKKVRESKVSPGDDIRIAGSHLELRE